jgi:hypothetical protein
MSGAHPLVQRTRDLPFSLHFGCQWYRAADQSRSPAARRTRRMEPTVEVTLSNRKHRPTAAHPQR